MQKFQYTVSRTRKLTTGLSLSIHPEKGVRVRAPFWVPDLVIRKFVEEKRAWIEKHLSKIKPTPTTATTYLEGEKHLYFGVNQGCRLTTEDYIGVMQSLGLSEQTARNLYPDLLNVSRKLVREREEERSILVGKYEQD